MMSGNPVLTYSNIRVLLYTQNGSSFQITETSSLKHTRLIHRLYCHVINNVTPKTSAVDGLYSEGGT